LDFEIVKYKDVFFSLEYAGELRIIALRDREMAPYKSPPPHSEPSREGDCKQNKVL
jgi:hypothetical protein